MSIASEVREAAERNLHYETLRAKCFEAADEIERQAYYIGETNVDMQCKDAEIERLSDALERIYRWFGEFPATGRTWPGSGESVSYGAQYGSNGERDFMRKVAAVALEKPAAEIAQLHVFESKAA